MYQSRDEEYKNMDKDFNVDQLRDILTDLYGEVLSLLEECPGI